MQIQRNYRTTGKAALLHSSCSRYIVAVGGMGSGKSRAIIEEIIQTGMQYPGCAMAVYRKTMPSLRDSTMKEFRTAVVESPELGHWREKEDQFLFTNGSFVNFRGLDDPEKAKSTNYVVIWMEEGDEFEYEDFLYLNDRIRSKGFGPLRLIISLNPVDEDHWIYKTFVDNFDQWDKAGQVANPNSGPGCEVIHFSTYDNLHNLPPGYIEQISAGRTPEEIERYVYGKWGTIVKGRAVYGKICLPAMHIRRVNYAPGMVVCRGWDFGYNHPACVWRVIDPLGRKNIHHEMLGDSEYIVDFGRRVIQATEERYPRAQVYDYCDPRGFDKSDKGPKGKSSTVDLLQTELGIYPVGERGVREYVEPGIQIVRKELQTLIEGVPELTISPDCKIIRSGYFGRYVRDDEGFPKKDGYYDHICDADRYIAYNHKSNAVVKDLILARKAQKKTPRNRYTGY